MISLILSAVAALGGGTFVAGLLFRFVFMAPVARAFPAVANALVYFAEGVLAVFWRFLGAFARGGYTLTQQRWEVSVFVVTLCFAAGWYSDRYDPVRNFLPAWLQSRPPVAASPVSKAPAKKAAPVKAKPPAKKTAERHTGAQTVCNWAPGICEH